MAGHGAGVLPVHFQNITTNDVVEFKTKACAVVAPNEPVSAAVIYPYAKAK